MTPIDDLPADVAKRLQGVLFDIDDTVLDHGRLGQSSLAALYRLQTAGVLAIGVTGRPVTWGQVLVRQWPVAGMVTENGPLWVVSQDKRIRTLDRLTSVEREQRSQRLLDLAAAMRRQFPEVEPTDDATSRISDFTFDIGETLTVAADRIAEMSRFARERGARVTRSSIHLHVTYDADDKATGVLRFLSHVFGKDPTASRYECAFIGDSENDAPCFAAFQTTVAVANFRGRPSVPPRFVTSGRMGTGFSEFVDRLLERRRA